MKLLSEALGFLGIVLNIVIYQQKKRKPLLRWKLVSDVAWGLHYAVAGNYSGAAVGTIGIARESSFLAIEGKKIDRRPFLAIFFVCACISVWVTWKGWASLLPAAASILSVISFDILVGSVTGIGNELLTLGSVFIGIYRHDRKKAGV